MFKALFKGTGRKRSPQSDPHHLYGAVVAAARAPHLYRDFGVPDTFDGRFEMMVVHLYLLIRRIKMEENGQATQLSQSLFDLFIDDMSVGLREAGVGDSVVPKRLGKMARVFYGRVKVWDEAMDQVDSHHSLTDSLERNLFPEGDVEHSRSTATALSTYMHTQATNMSRRPLSSIVQWVFDPVESTA